VNHAKVHRKSSSSALIPQLGEKKRPVRVTATRQRDMMVVLRDHLNNESAEWLDADETDLDHQGQQQTPNATAIMPVNDNIQHWTATPWEDV
jgi:hypothetical protein